MGKVANMLTIIKSSSLYQKMRAYKYKLKRRSMSSKKLTIAETESILVKELNITQGDTLLVHCGFGFLNADYTPLELIELLIKLVGKGGNIIMPFYPPGLSKDWIKSGRVFDYSKTRCSTGALAQEFSKLKGVHFSHHPIKPIIALGNDALNLTKDHDYSEYPYDEKSPYYKLSKLSQAKAIGLGVRNCSLVHMIEDLYEDDKSYLYSNEKIEGTVCLTDGKNLTISSYYHSGSFNLCAPKDFLDRYCTNIMNLKNINGTVFYSVNASSLLVEGKELFNKGVNRKCL